jgi:glycosyltransferase involved in cell wall biosynthesis
MKKVLLLTDVNFWERSSGNRARIYSLVEFLSRRVNLTVVNTGPAPELIESLLSTEFKSEFHVLEKTKYLNSNGYGRRLQKLVKNRQFDAIIIEYIHSSYFLNFLEDRRAKIILDAHDIISERTRDFKQFNYPGALYEMDEKTEIEILNVYDHIMAICQPDYDKINKLIGQDKALLCPHPAIAVLHPFRNSVKNIVFVASAYLPNADAINLFLENCWTTISEKYDVHLSIYGSVGGLVKTNGYQQVSLMGFVPEINDIYQEADIVINPVRFGAGLKIKNVEALANGIPLITTSHGARGLEAGINHAFLIADAPLEMIEAISSLIDHPEIRRKLGEQAHEFIKDRFSPGKCFGPLLDILN